MSRASESSATQGAYGEGREKVRTEADEGELVRPEGIEPPAYRFEACRSIHLSYGRTLRAIVVTGSPGLSGRGRRQPDARSVAERSMRGNSRHATLKVCVADVLRDVRSRRAGSSIGRAADS